MDNVPAYVSVVFMITTFVTVGIFLSAVKPTASGSKWARAILFTIPFWLIFQFFLARTGFFVDTAPLPPRVFTFGLGPALLLIAASFAIARDRFIGTLSLPLLTILHTIRIPVELTLAWLAEAKVVPEIMTFHGTNFDILSGVTAPLAFLLATRKERKARYALIFWNLLVLGLLFNIVFTAILCAPSPLQRLAFDRPNIAVLYSPYIWLPTMVVPIVFFSHLASLYQLFRRRGI